jgi:hypothetical protein
MGDFPPEKRIRQSGPFVSADRRPDILSKLVARAATQPAATSPAAIAAKAARPRSAAARAILLQRALGDEESSSCGSRRDSTD